MYLQKNIFNSEIVKAYSTFPGNCRQRAIREIKGMRIEKKQTNLSFFKSDMILCL